MLGTVHACEQNRTKKATIHNFQIVVKRVNMFLFLLFFMGNQISFVQAFSTTHTTAACRTFPPKSQRSWRHHRKQVEGKTITSVFAQGDFVLADDEPLSSRFQRAVVLQRAGDHMSALKEYQTFVKAAEQCEVSPATYAEVHGNIGAIYTKLKQKVEARKNFEIALNYREIGSAHVNLALLTLAEGQLSSDPRVGLRALNEAKEHCRKAVELDDDINSVNGATRLLGDIEKMLQRAGGESQFQ